MNFNNFLTRFDDELIQDLIGVPALRLMRLLDPELSSRSKLLDLVIKLHPPASMLLTREQRALLIDLLSPQEANRLALSLGAASENANIYQNLKQNHFRRGSEKEQALFDFFGLTPPKIDVVDQPPSIEKSEAGYGLFIHQRHAARELQQKLVQPPHRVVLHMPTGSGKTRTAMNIITDHLRQNEPSVVVWLAHSEELCDQAVEEFTKAWHYLGNRDVDVYRFWGNNELNIENIRDGFIVAGLSKAYSMLKRNTYFLMELGRRCSLLIIDEAHSAIAETYSLVLDVLYLQLQSTKLLGLTATPGRTWSDIDIDEELSTFFNRQKVSLQIEGYDNPVDYLVDDGYLARTDFHQLSYSGGSALTQAELNKVQDSLEIPREVLEKLAEDEQRNLYIITRIEEMVKHHKRIIIFATTVQHSELLAAVLSVRGVSAYSITSKTSSVNRSRLIERYRKPSDDVQVLCNFGVLTSGFDAPQTSATLIARPTKSLVLYSQMVGRAIRGPKAGGNAIAEVVTIVDRNLPGFGSVAEAFTNWEDIWE